MISVKASFLQKVKDSISSFWVVHDKSMRRVNDGKIILMLD